MRQGLASTSDPSTHQRAAHKLADMIHDRLDDLCSFAEYDAVKDDVEKEKEHNIGEAILKANGEEITRKEVTSRIIH